MHSDELPHPEKQPAGQKLAGSLVSFKPIYRYGWYVKFSTYDGNILLFFISRYTGKTVVRHFSNEIDAVEFINYMVSEDPLET